MDAHGKPQRTVSQGAHLEAPPALDAPALDAPALDAPALDAVGDRTRRVILSRLVGGPLSVAEVAAGMSVGRPAVSQHLKVLREAGLVTVEQWGTRRMYALDPRGIEVLRRYTEELWAASLDRFQEVADGLDAAAARAAPPEARSDREAP